MQACWWSYTIATDSFYMFTERSGDSHIPRWYLPLTMVAGAAIAGVAGQGGSVIAFPVMTLLFHLRPHVARDFSMLIQSVGGAATVTAFLIMKVRIAKRAAFWSFVGSVPGVILGMEYIGPFIHPALAKMVFVSILCAFAFALYTLNNQPDRKLFSMVPNWHMGERFVHVVGDFGFKVNWKAAAMVLCGFVGGMSASISGSGPDLITFATTTLLFGVSEKTACTTSMLCMVATSWVGVLWEGFLSNALGVRPGASLAPEALGFWFVVIPVSAFAGPLGGFVGSNMHRSAIANIVIAIDLIQFFTAWITIQPWSAATTSFPGVLCATSFAILVGGGTFCWWLANFGQRLACQEAHKLRQAQRFGLRCPTYTMLGGMQSSPFAIPVKPGARVADRYGSTLSYKRGRMSSDEAPTASTASDSDQEGAGDRLEDLENSFPSADRLQELDRSYPSTDSLPSANRFGIPTVDEVLEF
eukprot:scaffold388_cov244-Pinguiococcus_pyrenoidosus.AAC.30